jgi:gamma-glutamyltranspeptidase/glutathione hydrolase
VAESSALNFNEAQQPRPAPGVEAAARGPAMGARFAVATDHPLATLTAMNVLQSGGNAVDATIAASAVNVVTKPNRTHLGGDAFALIWHRASGKVECLNAGGRAPLGASLEAFGGNVPRSGAASATVPGLVDSWMELHARHGTRSMASLMQPAIGFSRDGFPVSLHLSTAMGTLRDLPEAPLRAGFLRPDGAAYAPGEAFRQPELASTLDAIASEGREGFYGGACGKTIAAAMTAAGAPLDLEDLARPTAHWYEPLKSSYRGRTVYEQALPSQGITLQVALNVVERFPLRDWGLGSADSVHVMVEATRMAFADTRRHAADPDFEDVPVEWLLSDEHADELAARIDMRRVAAGGPVPIASDTTSFVVADGDMAVCFIQSVFAAWGSRFYVPEAGVLMNNRMAGFHADPASPNHLVGGKRTVHTLNNFLVLQDGRLVVGGGTPGADFQVQTNLQVIAGVLDWDLDLQAAVDSPRWATATGGRLNLESRTSPASRAGLASRGHSVNVTGPWGARAASQLVSRLHGGGWAVASDLRGEGLALAL